MTQDAQGAHPGAHVHSGTVSGHAPADAITISDAHLLFTGDFKRAGLDLVVSGDGREVVLHDYFKGEKRAALASPDGAHLTGDIITALTGHTQFAQANGDPSVAQVIGHVTKLTGTATAIRNGVSIILNQGDNVNKGDVVASGSDSTLGITFIDGTVFGLASNAKMVLNEMIYDPNGSDNKSLISLVAGTISFVAGATAKHGDMKVDTPVATMGIRGTAVLVEIDFTVPATGGAPPAKFQVLVEPDGTTGSYILFDKTTLTPIATVNQAGTQTIVNGQGGVNFLSSAQLSADAQKIITDVFALKFSDLNNPNTKTATNFQDTIDPQTVFLKTVAGEDVAVKILTVNVADKAVDPTKGATPSSREHIPGPPTVITHDGAMTERALTTGSAALDTVIGKVDYNDINPGDVPTVKTRFDSFTYQNAGHTDVTATLTATQLAAIKAVEAPLITVQDPTNINFGSATWAYVVADSAFDFLAAGETLTLTYIAHVDNNFALNNEFKEVAFTITITGTNDTPVITSSTQAAAITELLATHDSTTPDTATGTIKFVDADLTDTHTVTITGVEIAGVTTGLAPSATVLGWLSLSALTDSTNGVTGSRAWTFSAQDKSFDYLAVGEQVTFTYTVQVDDHHGGVVTQPVTITITGTNDAPVITSGTQAVTLTEAPDTHDSMTPDTATGTITFTDLDLSDTHAVTITGMVASGVTTGLDSSAASWLKLGVLSDSTTGVTGSDVWSFSAADHYFDYLAEGEHVTLTYTVQVDDSHGGVVTQQVAVTINGSNDAPVAHADSDIGHIIEAGNNPDDSVYPGVADTSGNVLDNDTDLDLSDTHSVVGVISGTATATAVLSGGVGTAINGTYGWLTLNSNGTWTYHLDNSRAATDALAQGVHATDVFSYTDADNHGGTSTTTLSIDITGTNDAPVGANDAPLAASDTNTGAPIVEKGVNPGNTPFNGTATATGNVLTNDVDVDTGDTKTVQGVATGTPAGLQTAHVGSAVAGTYGSVTINADGTWTYTLDNDSAVTQALTQGQHVTDVFTYTMHDAAGATSSATLTIDVYGTNDAPVVAGTLSDGVNEGDAAFQHNLLAGASDIDAGETTSLVVSSLNYSIDGGTATAVLPPGVSLNADGHTLIVDPTNPAYDHLAVGEQTVITVSYNVQDVHGATVAQTETITIHGTNDAPVVAAALTDSVNEGDAASQHNLLAGATDVDDGETATLSVTGLSYSVDGGTATATLPPGVSLGTDGHTLIVDPTNPAYDHLAVGEQTVIMVSYNVQDVHGATVAQTETITIHGTNDAPVVAAALTDSVNEGDAASQHNLLAGATDVDDGETATLSVTGLSYSVDGGTTTSTLPPGVSLGADGHTLTVDPGNSAFDYLAAGEQTVIKVTYDIKDVHGATVAQTETITVHGTNDAPTITVSDPAAEVADSGGVSAPVSVAVADHVTITDVDASDVHTLYVTGTLSFDEADSSGPSPSSGTLGGLFTIDPDAGTITYDKAAFDYLAAGEQVVAKFTFESSSGPDSLQETISVTIDGADDPASIMGETDAAPLALMVTAAEPTVKVLAPGVTTNSLGLKTEMFDSQPVGHGSFHSDALGADFQDSGSAGVVHGSTDGVTAAPFFGPVPGAPDATNYLTVGGGGLETITFSSEQNAFGLYWGSVDSYNSISFYEGSKLVGFYTGADVTPLFSDGNQGSFASNGYVEFAGLANFNKVVLASSSNAFELDNISSGAIHTNFSASVSGTLSVHDADIGDALTANVIGPGIAQFIGADGSTHLPDGVDVAGLIDASDVTFDTVHSSGGTDVLHWTYHPDDTQLDFLKAGDLLKIEFAAEVGDGNGHTESQPLTVALVGANSSTNVSQFGLVEGTTGSDTFNNVGNGVTIFGNGGQDTFVFKPGFGSATIADFDPSNDTIEISKSLFADFADVLAHAQATNSNHDLIIADAASDTITLKGITAGQLHASNFHLV